MVGQLCMYIVDCVLTGLDMCVTSLCMYATMPPVRTCMILEIAFERAAT